MYILKSSKNQNLYVDSSQNIETRIKRHNHGYVKSTKANRPWRLMDYEEYTTRSEAVQRERFLKTGQQKELLKKRFKNK